MKGLQHKLLYIIGILFVCIGLQAQSLDQAKRLYNDGKYAEAKPAFEKLVQTSPSNSSYNHWYGVCCYETGDLATARKHLEVSAKKKTQESYRYLAELYFRTYFFTEAVEMYDEYIALLEKKKQDSSIWDAKRSIAEKAARMMDKTENIQIIDSIVTDKTNFLDGYNLSEESGSLEPYNKFFQQARPTESSVYMNEKKDKIYYAHETENNNYCLFTQSRLLDKWGDEKQLPMNVNSETDDNYPFALSDGVTIHYASKGNGSLGGYDLFVTRYNINSDTYLSPEQMGMPFNSPYNDYMMVIDEAKELGWFVSDRFQPEGKVVIYLFIPNKERKNIDTNNEAVKRGRAQITSISDSWQDGSDYKKLITLAHTEVSSGKNEVVKDFDFVITNDIIYYTLAEINSPEARGYYEKAIALRKQINGINQKLDTQRVDYTAAGKANREKLRPAILQAEKQLAELLPQPEVWEKKARNAEITFLRNKR